jgi:hypothetical protein
MKSLLNRSLDGQPTQPLSLKGLGKGILIVLFSLLISYIWAYLRSGEPVLMGWMFGALNATLIILMHAKKG